MSRTVTSGYRLPEEHVEALRRLAAEVYGGVPINRALAMVIAEVARARLSVVLPEPRRSGQHGPRKAPSV